MPSSQQQRRIFKTTQDWHDYIAPLLQQPQGIQASTLFDLRKLCYSEIEALREKPLLVYATKFIENVPDGAPNQIDLSDVDGFTDLVNSIPSEITSVDVLIHSPGGRPDATERIVEILRSRFQQVDFLIPHSAYSAATMLALSGNNIVLHPSATLGPVDPQVGIPAKNGLVRFVPAKSILNGFDHAKSIIKRDGAKVLPAYLPLIEQYSLDLFELCYDSEKLSKELVSTWLKKYMFAGQRMNGQKLKKMVSYFSDYNSHKIHSRPLTPEKIADLTDLKVSVASGSLKDLLWEAYILLNGFFSISPFIKLYESKTGVSWGKHFQMFQGGVPPQQPQRPPRRP